jgi:hypothetical protein
MKPDCIIAIDPDVDKSGVAVLDVKGKHLSVLNLPFPKLIDFLKWVNEDKNDFPFIVIVEAGWLNKSNWHLKAEDNIKAASAKGNSNGRNHQVGKIIVEMCRHYGIDVVEMRPLKKMWKGRDGKITHEELAVFTGITGRTNQEERDAALIAWVYAGLPIMHRNKSK